ncbi:MAG TPA: MaoC family dehydratase [Mycobacteriales bacterium]|nr:MaoC family dehydratase [Mycobacteriales bacterium]
MTKAESAYELFKAAIGESDGAGDWLVVDQARIDAFADVTEDHQFIHVDPKLAAEVSPWGVTIAHGFLTLSLLVKLCESIPQRADRLDGVVMGINYGFDKVRFINPVKVDSRIRASSVLSGVELKDPSTIQVTRTVTVEIENESKPALVAEWLSRIIYG